MKPIPPLLPILAITLAMLFAAPAQARDKRMQFDIASAVASGKAEGVLVGSVNFYFGGVGRLMVRVALMGTYATVTGD